MSNSEIFRKAFEHTVPSEELVERVLALKTEAVQPKRKISAKLAVIVPAAVLTVLVLGLGVYASGAGWFGRFFGSSAEKLTESGKSFDDYSAVLGNVEIRGDEGYSFEIVEPYIIDDFLFYGLEVRRTDGTPIVPAEENFPLQSGFAYSAVGENHVLQSDVQGETWSVIAKAEDGAVTVQCDLYAGGGFSAGDHIHIVNEKLYSGLAVTQNVIVERVEIEFDIEAVPTSGRKIIAVDETAAFEDGYSCRIEKIAVSPISILVTAGQLDGGDSMHFEDSAVVLKSGEVLDNIGVNNSSGAENEVFLFRLDGEHMRIIMPDEIAEVRIGNLTISCE